MGKARGLKKDFVAFLRSIIEMLIEYIVVATWTMSGLSLNLLQQRDEMGVEEEEEEERLIDCMPIVLFNVQMTSNTLKQRFYFRFIRMITLW